MIVHRILDVVFRTLDTVDAVRAKVGTLLGKEPPPASDWPPVFDGVPPRQGRSVDVDAVKGVYADAEASDAYAARPVEALEGRSGRAAQKTALKKAPGEKPAGKKAPGKKAAASTRPKPAKKAAPASSSAKGDGKPEQADAKKADPKKADAKKVGSHRKGSVDRKGVDFDSPRARAVETWLRDHQQAIVAEEAALDGKKTLARVLWAVGAADAAGSEHGLTAADASALLSSSAQLDVFATNVARAFRDESELFNETVPDGRSKRYKLTAAGRARLAEVATR